MNIKGNNDVDASPRHAIMPLAIRIEATEYRYKIEMQRQMMFIKH